MGVIIKEIELSSKPQKLRCAYTAGLYQNTEKLFMNPLAHSVIITKLDVGAHYHIYPIHYKRVWHLLWSAQGNTSMFLMMKQKKM